MPIETDCPETSSFDFYDSAPVGCCILNQAGQILSANHAMVASLGLVRPRFIGQPLTRYIPKRDHAIFHQTLKTVHSTAASQKLECRIKRRGIGSFWARLEIMAGKGTGNTPLFYLVMSDITEYKLVEDRLKESEFKQRQLLEFAGLGIGYYDPEGTLLFLNRRGTIDLGRPASQMVGKNMRELFGSEQGSVYLQRIRQVAHDGRTRHYEDEVAFASGKKWFLSAYAAILDGKDNVQGIMIISQDISEHKRHEENLKISEEKFRAIADYTVDWENWFSPDGRLLWINPAVERITGYSVEECQTMPDFPRPLFIQEDQTRIEGLFRDSLKGISREDSEFRIISKDGNQRWVSISSQPIYSDDGQPMGVRSSIRDISDRKHSEELTLQSREELRRLYLRLAEVEEAERLRISRELHDRIGQSLSVVGINLSLLRSQSFSDLPRTAIIRIDHALKQIEEIAESVRGVIADLRPPTLDDYGLFASLQWYIDRLQERTGLSIRLCGSPPERTMPATVAIALFRIAQEALTNILKHAQANRVVLTLAEREGCVKLTITDNGKGFRLPVQAGGSDHWGLLIMQERARSIGATLNLESSSGCGTTIRVDWKMPQAGKTSPISPDRSQRKNSRKGS